MSGYVQSDSAQLVNGTSLPLAYPSNVTEGNVLVAAFSGGNINSQNVTDTQGNLWVQKITQGAGTSNELLSVWITIASATGSNTVSVSDTGTWTNLIFIIAEFEDFPLFDTEASIGFGTSGGHDIAPVLAIPGELLITFIASAFSGTSTLTPSTGWVEEETKDSAANGTLTMWSQVYGSAGIYNLTGGFAGGTGCIGLLAFRTAPVSIDCGDPPDGNVGIDYSHTFPVEGGTPPYVVSISVGALPDGLVLDPDTGEVTGIPTTIGTSNFTVHVLDAAFETADVECSIRILPAPLTLSCGDPPSATVGVPYSHFFPVIGGVPPYTWTVLTSIPPGLSFNAATGEIAGTPTIDGVYPITVQVTDSDDPPTVVTVDCTINVTGPGTVIVHYWEEVPEGVEPRLLMGTKSGLFVAVDDSNTDNGNDVRGTIRTPSYDMGDPRTLKLFMDAMTDVDATGGYGVFAGYNNYSTTPFGVGTGALPGRAQYLSSLSFMPVDGLTLYRNVAFEYDIGVGTVLYEVEPSYYSQPFTSKIYTTQWLESGITGWKQLRYLRFAMISGAAVQFQILNDDGVVVVDQVIASTGGRLVNFFGQLPHAAKGRMLRYTASSDSEFVLFVENTSVRIKKWGGQQFVDVRPFVQ